MKWKSFGLLWILGGILCIAGCDGGGGPTGPSDAPILSNISVNSTQARPGSTIIFYIDFVDISGDVIGGTAFISDSQNNGYQEVVSDTDGTGRALTTFITLSPLMTPGIVTFNIVVQDLGGNSSNIISVTITIV